MNLSRLYKLGLLVAVLCLVVSEAHAQSFMVQCPASTITHPNADNNSEPAYNGHTTFSAGPNGYLIPTGNINGAIKCQQISGGDGFATMGDGTQTYLFAFGPLSGLADIADGKPGTEFPSVFNTIYSGRLLPGDPATTASFSYNGAVGLINDLTGNTDMPIEGFVDPRPIMDIGTMNGNMPAPTFVIDEDDEFFLTLTNVGMIMRPDLFEQHTVHFHGYPNASSFYDGVPDASVAINIAGSFTYYYLAPDAGTYLWHCHITPPEHLQMGMVGQVYVHARQDRVPEGGDLYAALQEQQNDPRTKCDSSDILCSNPLPAVDTGATRAAAGRYAYNDGDGSTYYDVEYPLQIHGFDPNFHFVGMTFNPENFTDMKNKYFLLNGRSYPDTVTPGPIKTMSPDGVLHDSQPISSLINVPAGGKALLRISDLDTNEYQTLASLGIPMTVVGRNAKLLRDQAGNDLAYKTNSITVGGGESLDVILDASNRDLYHAGQIFYLYTPNLDHLSNDAENYGGLMTEVHICNSVNPVTKACN